MGRGKNTEDRAWTRNRLLLLLANAYFDVFSDPHYKPTDKDLERWFNRYLKRETFKQRKTRKDKKT